MIWFIDGGAHRGESIRLARKIYGEVTAIAIEPLTECWVDLANEGALVIPAALWTSFGQMPFYCGDYEVSSTLLSEKATGGISMARSRLVAAVTLASVLRVAPGAVAKLDIEGAEYDVLEQALDRGVLAGVRDLYVDFHGSRIRGFSRSRHEALVRRLLDLGYPLPKWIPGEERVIDWGRKWITEEKWT